MMLAARKVPRLSLQTDSKPSEHRAFAHDLLNALAEFGFVVIADHGIPAATFTRAYELAERLFELPLESKLKYELGNGQRGYIGFGRESAKGNAHPDLKEYWHVGPQLDSASAYFDEYPKNVWPEQDLPEFRSFFLHLYSELNKVSHQILNALELAMELRPKFFSDLIHEGNSVQRLIHYPTLSDFDAGNSLRAAPHADINLMTLLVGATDSGLEILDRDGAWLPINNQANDLVVDTGDMMALLTNNFLPATIHRVVNPIDRNRPRYSIPFFVHPHNHALLSCLPKFMSDGATGAQFTAITAGDFLQQRLRENGF